MINIEAMAGQPIGKFAEKMIATAQEYNDIVFSRFNNVSLYASPNTKKEEILNYFDNEMNRAVEEYRKSTKYKNREIEQKKRRECANIELDNALRLSPIEPSVHDREVWDHWRSVNTDPYGNRIMEYASQWMRMMEGRMSQGQTIVSCMQDTARIADNDGISGYMYGAAVSIIKLVWIHKDEFCHALELIDGDSR